MADSGRAGEKSGRFEHPPNKHNFPGEGLKGISQTGSVGHFTSDGFVLYLKRSGVVLNEIRTVLREGCG
jgi:hypothetical protein